MSPDRGHFHHRLIDLGIKQHHVALIAYAVTASITGLGFFMIFTRSMASVSILLICLTLLLVLFRLIGSVKLRDVLNGIHQRLDRVQEQRSARRTFEEAQLRFRNAETLDQWWGCVCTAAHAFDFACVSLELASHQNSTQNLTWKKDNTSDSDSDTDIILENLLQVRIPIKDRHTANPLLMQIQVKPNGSLETAGHRIALFTRLADEFAPNSQPAEPEG